MKRTTPPVARRGAILIYSIYIMLLMTAMISLAVDYGRVQMIKTELQRAADATARGRWSTMSTAAAARRNSARP